MASLTERIGTYGPDIMKKVIEAYTSFSSNRLSCKEPMVWFNSQNPESKLQTKYDVDFSA